MWPGGHTLFFLLTVVAFVGQWRGVSVEGLSEGDIERYLQNGTFPTHIAAWWKCILFCALHHTPFLQLGWEPCKENQEKGRLGVNHI